ncbi:hypothetical protein [Bordetella sp. BOR01]|uniref:hypothetical protein n=1 Tax=Bordetella sp. BOR01 TaxID=2854779 RepID=UPI001C44E48F|nr:hypothetical protein [Bordetella sp. BOR01]MBV7482531.1 hypothetical protein [Bordetella sp. BOR01]
MAWTNIPDSSLEPGKPIRSVDGLALRDNPIAIANGDAGAPRIYNAAYAETSITWNKLVAGAATAFNSGAFNLSFGAGSGTNTFSFDVAVPHVLMGVVMVQWMVGLGVEGNYARLYHGGAIVRQGDQVADSQLWALASLSLGTNTFTIDFERPSGGVMSMSGLMIAFAPIR